MDSETWVIEAGDRLIQKEVRDGFDCLSEWESLVYALWAADYGMRNAGDLDTARDVFPEFQAIGLRAAEMLALRATSKAFALARQAFSERHFELFEAVCGEVQNAEHDDEADGGA